MPGGSSRLAASPRAAPPGGPPRLLPQPAHAGEHAGLDGAQRRAGERGDLPLGVAAVVGERQRLALRRRQHTQRRPHLVGDHPGPGLLLDVARRQRRVQRQLVLRHDLPAALGLLPAHGIHRLVVHDGEQPRGDAAPPPVVGGRIAPDAEEHLLQDVLGQCVVGQDPAGQRERRTTEPLVEVVDGAGVARPDAAQTSASATASSDAVPGMSRLPWSHASFGIRRRAVHVRPPDGSRGLRAGIRVRDRDPSV